MWARDWLANAQVDHDRLRRLGVYEVAYLRGGAERVRLTSLNSLVQQGHLRHVSGGLEAVGDVAAPVHPLEVKAPASVGPDATAGILAARGHHRPRGRRRLRQWLPAARA